MYRNSLRNFDASKLRLNMLRPDTVLGSNDGVLDGSDDVLGRSDDVLDSNDDVLSSSDFPFSGSESEPRAELRSESGSVDSGL